MTASRTALRLLLAGLPLVLVEPADAVCTEALLFGTGMFITTGDDPHFIAAGDFNEDGIIDLAVATSHYVVSSGAGSHVDILIGVGNGTFAPPVPYLAGNAPYGIAVGDFDEDGIQDLAVANILGDNLSILRGLGVGGVGNGTFASPIHFPTGARPFHVITGDFNEDDITDLAISGNGVSPGVQVLLGLGTGGVGNGAFGSHENYPLLQLSAGIASGDFNEDGITDLLATEYTNYTIGVLLGNGSGGVGNGTFAAADHISAGLQPFEIAVADLNDDGILDLAVSNQAGGGVTVMYGLGAGGTGNGTFGLPLHFGSGGDNNTASIVTGDYNGDGLDDLAVCYTDHEVRVFLGPTFTTTSSYLVGDVPLNFAQADFDGDGLTDLAVANYFDDDITILLGDCFGDPVSTLASLVDAKVTGNRAVITWALSGATASATVYRFESGDWISLGQVVPDGMGRIRFEDADLAAGATYRYRLGIMMDGAEQFAGEVSVVVHAAEFAIHAVRPNPVASGRDAFVSFTLAEAGAATLELVDATGRRVSSHRLQDSEPGSHTVRLESVGSVRPGVYFVRILQNGRTAVTKAMVLQ